MSCLPKVSLSVVYVLYFTAKEVRRRRFTEKLSSTKFITLNFFFSLQLQIYIVNNTKTSKRKVYINRIGRKENKQSRRKIKRFSIFLRRNKITAKQVKNDISQALYLFNISNWITAGGNYCPVSLASRCARSTDIVFMCL